MTTPKKKPQPPHDVKTEIEQSVLKANNPLIFISHDTRDAELAEEFSNLLKSASAGGLKSFRSSDKKGTQGIEYGLDWYPAIMDKIDEASDVVCLLTQRSVERPWILYEAGVAKGKLGKKVIGVAMGIQHSIAFTGPFAQFQNNDGSIESITKLVIDLVRSVPGLDPERNYVVQLVESFHKRSSEIISKYAEESTSSIGETNDNIIVAKLFEEVKIMFENLPSRIERRIDPESRKKKRRLHPGMIEEVMHLGLKSRDLGLGLLMLLSFYKEDFPWLYDIGMETYKDLKTSKTLAERKRIIISFQRTFDMIGHPIFMDLSNRPEDMYMWHKEMKHVMNRFFETYLTEEKI